MISIIVPAFNVEKSIGACLEALLTQTLPRDQYEIIVVDDGSTDGTRARAESKNVQVIAQPNRGAGAARNTGAQHARGDLVLFIDADSVPDARWLEKMIAPFADANVAGVSGEKKTRQKNLWARYVQAEYDYKYDRIAAHRHIDFIDSSTAAYRRDVFLANDGFDTTLSEAEDVELSFRLAERGYRMVLTRDAITLHNHPESLGEFLRRKYRYAIWRALVYARFPRKAARDTRTPPSQKFQVALAFLLALSMMVAMFWTNALWIALALIGLFFASTIPFAVYCWRASPLLACVAPITLLLAAYAGGAGAIVGMFKTRLR
jgi:cellulose synthase/poly-beta-1,6-N-acetylglucosamine synthase-like glycosyltransferase